MKLRIFVQQDIFELHLKKEIKQLVSKTVSSFFSDICFIYQWPTLQLDAL